MFERFTDDARQTVVQAQYEARELRHAHIGTEHLLLGLLGRESTPSAQVLRAHGLTREAVIDAITAYRGSDDLDAEALTTLGIDLEAVRNRVEAAFGPGALEERAGRSGGRRSREGGHIPFTPRAKKVLELSLRETLALKQNRIADGHILLGLLREGDGLAAKVLHDRGIDPAAVRREITAALTR
jgi:ATP-dependent Clp protease ATP-binding subunit ClpA